MRNCAANTLFELLLGNGRTFPLLRWQRCLDGVVLPLLARVDRRAARAATTRGSGGGAGGGVTGMSQHHSSDSERKQWDETHVLVLQALRRRATALEGRPRARGR